MKWLARKPRWSVIDRWHSCFALFPHFIPGFTADSIDVPSHWIWLERYDRRWSATQNAWVYRPYSGTPSLRKLQRP